MYVKYIGKKRMQGHTEGELQNGHQEQLYIEGDLAVEGSGGFTMPGAIEEIGMYSIKDMVQ